MISLVPSVFDPTWRGADQGRPGACARMSARVPRGRGQPAPVSLELAVAGIRLLDLAAEVDTAGGVGGVGQRRAVRLWHRNRVRGRWRVEQPDVLLPDRVRGPAGSGDPASVQAAVDEPSQARAATRPV